jgi:hypothetical protein
MPNSISVQSPQTISEQLLSITPRLTIGSTVCITEGLSSAIGIMLPHNQWLYIVGLMLTFATWLAFLRFRDSKLGADIGDLCFYELGGWAIALACYHANFDMGGFWFFFTGIFALKIIRVYIWESSATQQYGWGQFGPMTRRYARRSTQPATPTPWEKLGGEIVLALLVAAFVCIAIRAMPDILRVVVVWVLPLSFEFIYGPRQLRNLNLLNNQLKTSTQATTPQETENAELHRTIEAYRQMNKLPNEQPDEMLLQIIEGYYKTVEMKRKDMLNLVNKMAEVYPAPSNTNN